MPLLHTDRADGMVEAEAMASTVRIFPCGGSARQRSEAVHDALAMVGEVEAACSRFDPSSALSKLNSDPWTPAKVPVVMAGIVAAASESHRSSSGRFDPRVIDDLEDLGYDRTFSSLDTDMVRPVPRRRAESSDQPWEPIVDEQTSVVDLKGERIDLGGIAKGAAADLALDVLSQSGLRGLVDIGGDGVANGVDEQGQSWSIGVEDPAGGADPVAVFSLSTGGYATSSVRIRRWSADGKPVHHLIDPTTGLPGGDGLLAVTVLAPSATRAEVASKSAFLSGSASIAEHAARDGLACLWIGDDGSINWSVAMAPHLEWVRP